MLGGFRRKKRVPKRDSFLVPFYVDFGGHFGGPKPLKTNIKNALNLDHFWDPSQKGPGAVFGGFWLPKWEGFGGPKWCKNGVDNERCDFQFLKEKPMVFQYFGGLEGPVFH